MTISFPKINVNIIPGISDISNAPQKVLFIHQKIAAGTALPDTLVQNILNDGSEDTLFGRKSMLAYLVREFKKVNKNTRVDAIVLDDAIGSVKASATITISVSGGITTKTGLVKATVLSEKNFTFSVQANIGSTPTTIAGNIAATINADLDGPFTASNVADVITITASNGGLFGNKFGVSFESEHSEVTGVVVGFSGGTTEAFPNGTFDLVENERYQSIVAELSYFNSSGLMTELVDFLDPRFNSENRILDGVGIVTVVDSFSDFLSIFADNDSPSLVIIPNKEIINSQKDASAIFEFSTAISGHAAAIRSLRLTEEANISSIVTATVGSLDSLGGKEIASLPYFNTPFSNLTVIDIENEFSQDEFEQLEDAGFWTLGNNLARNSIISGQAITTNKTTGGVPNTTFRFLNSVDTSSVIREFFFNNAKARFAQTRLTEGSLVNNRSIANEASIRAFFIGIFSELQGVLIQDGEDSRSFFIQNLEVVLDVANGKVSVEMSVPIVGQIREIVANMKIVFSTNN